MTRAAAVFLACVLVLVAPLDARAADDPLQRVKALVALDVKGDWTPIFANAPTPLMRENFSPAFNEAWAAAMTRNAEFPVFDADPLTGVQSGGGALTVQTARMDGPDVVATLARRDAPSARRVVTFVMEPFADGRWLIGDVRYPDGSSLRASLAAALRRPR